MAQRPQVRGNRPAGPTVGDPPEESERACGGARPSARQVAVMQAVADTGAGIMEDAAASAGNASTMPVRPPVITMRRSPDRRSAPPGSNPRRSCPTRGTGTGPALAHPEPRRPTRGGGTAGTAGHDTGTAMTGHPKARTVHRGRGVDVIFDPVGGDVFDLSLKVIAFEGRVLIIGFAGGAIRRIVSDCFAMPARGEIAPTPFARRVRIGLDRHDRAAHADLLHRNLPMTAP